MHKFNKNEFLQQKKHIIKQGLVAYNLIKYVEKW